MKPIQIRQKQTFFSFFPFLLFIFIAFFILNLNGCVINPSQTDNSPKSNETQAPAAIIQFHVPKDTDISAKDAYTKGIEYSTGTKDTPPDLERAVEWIKYSANQGYPEAQYKLGLMYLQGIGVTVNQGKAFHFMLEAEQKEAQFYLSYFYRYGIGTQTNFILADYWLDQAKQHGARIETLDIDQLRGK